MSKNSLLKTIFIDTAGAQVEGDWKNYDMLISLLGEIMLSVDRSKSIDDITDQETMAGINRYVENINATLERLHPKDINFRARMQWNIQRALKYTVVKRNNKLTQSELLDTIKQLKKSGMNDDLCQQYIETKHAGRFEQHELFATLDRVFK